jgi:hypothetical protein
MSQLSRGIFGAIAVSLSFGAIQFAPARDLNGIPQESAGTPNSAINRAAKADRAAAAAASELQTRTISLRPSGLSDTSVLVRVPVAKAVRNAPPSPAPSARKPGDRRMAVACEPVVSVLTEVAKLLQPGRCVT